MRVLLDTSTLLWASQGSRRVPQRVQEILQSPDNDLFISIVSPWEISVKQSIGRVIDLGGDLRSFVERALRVGYRLLPVELDHIARMQELPLIHRDPFDRMLIAQALVEAMPLLTSDSRIAAYDIGVIW